MMSDKDIKKLKTIFATKDDLKRFATKEDLKRFATKDDLKRFATKEDLKRFATKDDLKRFATKEDLKRFATKDDLEKFATKKGQEETIAGIKTIIEMIGDEREKNDEQDEILDTHEHRLDRIEDKVYSAT
jgi:hypothetical protein